MRSSIHFIAENLAAFVVLCRTNLFWCLGIRLRQSKTGVRVQIPVGAPLKVALDEAAKCKCSPTVLLNSDGRPWTQGGFRASWGKASDKAGICLLYTSPSPRD